ncbi:ABC transporter ATP-binding protein [Rhizobium sp. XQZ8]|uniref:ABC transporter ATP-binding protein n=1 Tax=Rhizobium populisoli TaxID=2859785 RepID=UPI001C67F2FC|nr:ABC transporter ATP-binding protein [Rhizobium populisoli]MBW6426007.1 ABC transporter ATP-binding protein [Rhizobium populisoli]
MLLISGLTKHYASAEGPVEVLKGIDFQLRSGESVALTGESGSGKSTLLHLAGGLDRPDAGTINLNGKDVTNLDDKQRAGYRRYQVGMIFQQFNLIPSLDVASNISFHARLAGRHDPLWQEQLVEALGLSLLLTRYPEQLSGGQQQRVAIGRTLAAKPSLVLADEPTGNLDEATGDNVLDLMLLLTRSAGLALLMVTHSSRLADRLDRKVILRGGKIVA